MKSENYEIINYNKWINNFKGWNGNRISIINHLIKKFNYKTYLEIGVRLGSCFKQIEIDHKDGVDPVSSPYVNFNMTSDEFFNSLEENYEYDIIFIDGLHYDYQVYKDILNSLNHLSYNGTIVCHDMNPLFEICQRKISVVSTWNGDCWKAFATLRSERDDLEMLTVDVDHGVGIIKKGKQETITIPEDLNYDFLNTNRKEIMNLITISDFYKIF